MQYAIQFDNAQDFQYCCVIPKVKKYTGVKGAFRGN